MDIRRNRSAFLVVDMVHDFAHPAGAVFYPQNRDILPAVLEALQIARENGLTVIFAQHYHRQHVFDKELQSGRRICCVEGTGGEAVIPELNYDERREYIVKKRRYNAFAGTDLDLILRENAIGNLVIVGTKTNCCIRATVEGAYHLDYNAIVIKDCVATNDETIQTVHLTDIDKYLGKVVSLAEFRSMVTHGEIHG